MDGWTEEQTDEDIKNSLSVLGVHIDPLFFELFASVETFA
jgi:hypothetical protein